MISKKDEKIRLSQIAYTSEWALAKFFNAILNDASIKKKFELVSICGREKDKVDAICRLKAEIKKRADLLADGVWRSTQKKQESYNLVDLMDYLFSDKIEYYQVRRNNTLPPEVYERCDAVVIHSISSSHLSYLRDAIDYGKHVLCEKPLVPVLDDEVDPDKTKIEKLEKIIKNSKLILMDAEHYSYKEASLIFYAHEADLLEGKKIKYIEGELMEIDNPASPRTQDILDPKNKIGLLGDTGIHLEAFISCLGGEQEITGVQFDSYPEYFVDTYDEVEFKVKGAYFTGDAKGKFTVAKFIDKLGEKEESKYIKLILEDDSEIVVDFKEGTVTKKEPGKEEKGQVSKQNISENEYVNILHHFYAAIRNGEPPITDVRNSLKSLRFLHQAYSFKREKIEVYQNGTGH